MKKYFILTTVFAALLLIIGSCSKKEFNLVNTWKNEKFRSEEFADPNWFAFNFEGQGKVTFYDDKSGKSTCDEFIEGDFTWTLTGTKLTISKSNYTREYKLITMEYDTLVAERDARDEDGNGYLYTFTFSLD